MADRNEWESRLDALEALPILPTLALRFIELGKDPDAELQDYVRVAQGDPSLSAKLLAVGNSAWIGARHEIRTVKQAVGLLGTNNVRALAISYCLAGLHSVWKLPQEEAESYWQAALCKAAAAELLTEVRLPKRSEEAFTLALFQDIGIGLLAATGGREYVEQLQAVPTVEEQLRYEKERFDADHTQVGECIAQRLKLPQLFVSGVSLHHVTGSLTKPLQDADMARAVEVAALLPHDIRSWKPQDVARLEVIIHEHYADRWASVSEFVQQLQTELQRLLSLLNTTGTPPDLDVLIREACAENARCTATLVGQVQSLVTNNNNLAAAVSALTGDQAASEMRANRDALTGLLNREGFEKLAGHVLEKACRGESPLGVAMFDLDHFKQVNDTHGHSCGDMLLKTVAGRLRSEARSLDLVCRWGGDEIVVLLQGLGEAECTQAVGRLQHAVMRDPVTWRDLLIPLRMSAGVLWREHVDSDTSLLEMIEKADVAMYESKRLRQGNVVVYGRGQAACAGSAA